MQQPHPFCALALALLVASPAMAADETPSARTEPASKDIVAGRMLYASPDRLVGPIYRVSSTGNPVLIIDSRLVTVPVSTLTLSGRRLVTSLTYDELRSRTRR